MKKYWKWLVLLIILAILIFVDVGKPNMLVISDYKYIPTQQVGYSSNRVSETYAGPPLLIKNMEYKSKKVEPGSEITLFFKRKPDSINIIVTRADTDKSIEMEQRNKKNFLAPSEQGLYYVVVSGKWNDVHSSKVFFIEIE